MPYDFDGLCAELLQMPHTEPYYVCISWPVVACHPFIKLTEGSVCSAAFDYCGLPETAPYLS